jgi:glyoxalase family protein
MEPQIQAKSIHHVSLIARKAERTADFYVELLGLHRDDRRLGDEHSGDLIITRSDSEDALFTVSESADRSIGQIGVGTTHHVALAVASFDALLKWKRWLEHKKVVVQGPYDQQAYQDIIFTDPDGVLVEIATQGPGWQATQDGNDVYSPPKESMAPYRNEQMIRAQTWPRPVEQIEPDMRLGGFHHISTIISSLEKSDDFYRDVLGLPLVRKTLDHNDPEVQHWYWGREGGRPGTVITAFPVVHAHGSAKTMDGRAGVGVVDHFALRVDMNEEELRKRAAALIDPREMPIPGHPTPLVSLHSPDGAAIDLIAADSP